MDWPALKIALEKPIPTEHDMGDADFFDPWTDVIEGISGSYSSESDRLMIETLKAVRDGTTFDFIRKEGFIVEFMLYVLAGHGMLEYGTSPRGGWPDNKELWQPLIDKWEAYAIAAWGENFKE